MPHEPLSGRRMGRRGARMIPEPGDLPDRNAEGFPQGEGQRRRAVRDPADAPMPRGRPASHSMRLRDAIADVSKSHWEQRRPLFVSASASVVLHGVLLFLALGLVVRQTPVQRLITVSLLPGGGGGGSAGANVPGPAAAPVQEPAVPPRAETVRKPVAPPRPARPAPAAKVPARPSVSDTAATTSVAPGPDVRESAAGGVGSGSGEGTGSGSGYGSGSGSGAGSGSGSRSGSGDQRAHCVYCPEPQYPTVARRRGWQGTVYVGLIVLADGTVEDASVRLSSGHQVLDQAAVAAARQSKFTPPVTLGLPSPLQGRIEYRFQLATR
jgi:protein TonB